MLHIEYMYTSSGFGDIKHDRKIVIYGILNPASINKVRSCRKIDTERWNHAGCSSIPATCDILLSCSILTKPLPDSLPTSKKTKGVSEDWIAGDFPGECIKLRCALPSVRVSFPCPSTSALRILFQEAGTSEPCWFQSEVEMPCGRPSNHVPLSSNTIPSLLITC